jgi:hypothetical protein
VCIREGLPLLHDDRDFDHLATLSVLKLSVLKLGVLKLGVRNRCAITPS